MNALTWFVVAISVAGLAVVAARAWGKKRAEAKRFAIHPVRRLRRSPRPHVRTGGAA